MCTWKKPKRSRHVKFRQVARPLTPLGAWSSNGGCSGSEDVRDGDVQAPSIPLPFTGARGNKAHVSRERRGCCPSPRGERGEGCSAPARGDSAAGATVAKTALEDQVPGRVRGHATCDE